MGSHTAATLESVHARLLVATRGRADLWAMENQVASEGQRRRRHIARHRGRQSDVGDRGCQMISSFLAAKEQTRARAATTALFTILAAEMLQKGLLIATRARPAIWAIESLASSNRQCRRRRFAKHKSTRGDGWHDFGKKAEGRQYGQGRRQGGAVTHRELDSTTRHDTI